MDKDRGTTDPLDQPLNEWIGVDLDGTLVEYHGFVEEGHIGRPIEPMVTRVKQWLEEGKDVRIFTARVGWHTDPEWAVRQRGWIEAWCIDVFGQTLPITCEKDYCMIELWDDRCIQLEPNTGRRIDEDTSRR